MELNINDTWNQEFEDMRFADDGNPNYALEVNDSETAMGLSLPLTAKAKVRDLDRKLKSAGSDGEIAPQIRT